MSCQITSNFIGYRFFYVSASSTWSNDCLSMAPLSQMYHSWHPQSGREKTIRKADAAHRAPIKETGLENEKASEHHCLVPLHSRFWNRHWQWGKYSFPPGSPRIQCPKLFFNTGHQFLMINEGKLRTFINLYIKIIEILIWHDLFLILRVKLEEDTKVSSNSREEYKDGN